MDHSNRIFTIKPVAECGELIYKTNNGGSYRRPDPEIFGPRADWVAVLQDKEIGRVVDPPAAEVYRIKSATVWKEGIVTTEDDAVVAESLLNVGETNTMKAFKRGEDPGSLVLAGEDLDLVTMPETTYVHAGQPWDSNYGHWLMDCLPRVMISQQAIGTREACYLLNHVSPRMHRVMLESLAPFGIAEESTCMRASGPIKVGELIYARPMMVSPWIAAPITLQTLSGLGFMLSHKTSKQRPSRIYVRREGSRRNLANQDALSAMATQRGYTVINPAAYTLAEQAAIFSRARIIVGPLGAELVNTAFAPPGVTLVTMSSSLAKDGYYWNLASLAGGKYIGLHGHYVGQPTLDSDFEINPALFTAILDRIRI